MNKQMPDEVATDHLKVSGLVDLGFSLNHVGIIAVVDRAGSNVGHPYTIGERHIVAANAGGGIGILDEAVCRRVRCAHRGCKRDYDDHICQYGMFLNMPCEEDELPARWSEFQPGLAKLAESVQASEYKIEGFAFVGLKRQVAEKAIARVESER